MYLAASLLGPVAVVVPLLLRHFEEGPCAGGDGAEGRR